MSEDRLVICVYGHGIQSERYVRTRRRHGLHLACPWRSWPGVDQRCHRSTDAIALIRHVRGIPGGSDHVQGRTTGNPRERGRQLAVARDMNGTRSLLAAQVPVGSASVQTRTGDRAAVIPRRSRLAASTRRTRIHLDGRSFPEPPVLRRILKGDAQLLELEADFGGSPAIDRVTESLLDLGLRAHLVPPRPLPEMGPAVIRQRKVIG